MNKFKVGDYVVAIAGPDKSSKVHVVESSGNPTYPLRVGPCAYTADGRLFTSSNSSCMRLATIKEIAAMQKPKPIRRGDLVEFCGNIWVVIDAHLDHGGCWIGAITGDPETRYSNASELTRVGSIRKKVKQLKAQVEYEK